MDAAGFFLLLPDGTVAAGSALGDMAAGNAVPPERRPSLAEFLGLGAGQDALFSKWLNLVRLRHRDLRWDKLAALAPLQEIRIDREDGTGYAPLAYRKLLDGRGELAAVAVTSLEPGAGRSRRERRGGESGPAAIDIGDVLALAANPPETVGAFFGDARQRLESAAADWDAWLAERRMAGEADPAHWSPDEDVKPGRRLFRELHMVKGNAGAFGFHSLAAVAQAAEDALEELKRPSRAGEHEARRLADTLAALRAQFEEMQRALKMIAGEGQEAMTRVLKWKLERLIDSAAALDGARLEPAIGSLVEATRRLAFLSPAYLARKYRHLVDRLALNLGKPVAFRVTGNSGDIHPESFARVDEALVHILRNMVDHGIETPAERAAAGKGEAEIELEYVDSEDRVFLRIRDNGRGMDADAIAARGVDLGLLTRDEAEALDEVGRLGIIFREGFTTRDEAGMVSGRGLGLALAARSVADRGGNLYVYSRPGEGTRFAIELPPIGRQRLPRQAP